jgi:hypothetical protein
MAIDTTAINTKGAVITIGGVAVAATSPDGDGIYWGTVSGIDLGCTQGGINVSYNYEKRDIYCDQTLSAVKASVIEEKVDVSVNMLETDAAKLQYAIANETYVEDVGVARKIGIGGSTALTYVPLKLEVADETSGLLTTWTFHKVLPGSIELNFERDNPTVCRVTFTAYAQTSYSSGHQLSSIHEALA